MTEEELLKYITITDDKVIFDKSFYVDIIIPCINNTINKQQLISFSEDKIKEYEEMHVDNDEALIVFQEVLDFINKGGKNE